MVLLRAQRGRRSKDHFWVFTTTWRKKKGGGKREDPQAQRSQILSHDLVLQLPVLTGKEVHDYFPDFQMLT